MAQSDIAVRLGGDNSEFRGMLDQSVTEGDSFADKLSTRIGDRLVGLREVSHTVATALGLNLEKISENLAHVFVDMSEAQAEAYKAAAALGDKATADLAKAGKARLDQEQLIQSLLKEEADITKKIADNQVPAVDYQKQLVDLIKTGLTYTEAAAIVSKQKSDDENTAIQKYNENQKLTSELIATQAEIEKTKAERHKEYSADADADQDALNAKIKAQGDLDQANFDREMDNQEELRKLKLAALPIDQQIAKVTDEIRTITGAIVINRKDGVSTTELEIKAQQDLKTLGDLLVKQSKDRLTTEQSVEAEFEKQLSTIAAMTGSGAKTGFTTSNPGDGSGSTTLGDLETAAQQAARALSYALAHPNEAGAQGIGDAQAISDRANANLQAAKSGLDFRTETSSSVVPLSLIDVSPIFSNSGGVPVGQGADQLLAGMKQLISHAAATTKGVAAIAAAVGATDNSGPGMDAGPGDGMFDLSG